MNHIGWFLWWSYEGNPDFKARDFYDLKVRGFNDNNEIGGEDYLKFCVAELRKEGKKYNTKLSDVGYEKAYVE